MKVPVENDPLANLKVENALLIALLESHGIEWHLCCPGVKSRLADHCGGGGAQGVWDKRQSGYRAMGYGIGAGV
jgi:hypothetical protein